MTKKQVFVPTRSERKALKVAEEKGISLPIAVKIHGGWVCYPALASS